MISQRAQDVSLATSTGSRTLRVIGRSNNKELPFDFPSTAQCTMVRINDLGRNNFFLFSPWFQTCDFFREIFPNLVLYLPTRNFFSLVVKSADITHVTTNGLEPFYFVQISI